MTSPAPVTTVLLVAALCVALTSSLFYWCLIPLTLALLNEFMRMWALRPSANPIDPDAEVEL